ncbi:MAG: hypothetical protein IKR04_06370 [Clostridia bacterium]|nr:hypothetical protein [Clostridia bacterium]
MPKLAIKTKKKVFKDNVFLKRSYDGYMQYGILELIDKREGHTNVIGKIYNNLLQEDITVSYEDDFEKFKIIEVIPPEFYYRVNMDLQKIYISFRRVPVKAPLFTNREYVDGFYKFLTCFDEEEEVTLNVTLKSDELSNKIQKMHKDIAAVQKQFFPSHFLTEEEAKKDVKSYLIYLMENYEVTIVEDQLNEYLSNMRKYYDNSDLLMYLGLLKQGMDGFSFQFIYKGETYKVTIGSKKTDKYFEDFDGFYQVYEDYIK